MDLRRLILILRQQLLPMVVLTLTFLLLFVMMPTLGKSQLYVSTSKVLLTPTKMSGSFDGREDSTRENWIADESTLKEMLSSERLLSRVRSSCGLKESWQELRERVLFEPLTLDYLRRVSLFGLSYSDADPKQAQKICEVLLTEFTSYVEELSAREYSSTRRFLEELVAEAKEKVDATEEKLLTLTTAHADAKQSEQLTENLLQLEADRRKLREEIALLEAEASSVQSFLSGGTAVPPSTVQGKADSGLTQLEGAVASAKLKLLELEQLYTDDNVQVVEQRAKLRKTEQLYQSRLSEFVGAINEEKNQIITQKRKSLQVVEERVRELRNSQLTPAQKREVSKLERQLSMWEENHLNLVKQLYQARVVEQSSRRQGAISILEQPTAGILPKDKKQKSIATRVGFGLPISFAISAVVVTFLDFVSSSLRLVPRIEEALGVPVLAVVPAVDDSLRELWESYKRVETLPKHYLLLLDESQLEASPAVYAEVAEKPGGPSGVALGEPSMLGDRADA